MTQPRDGGRQRSVSRTAHDYSRRVCQQASHGQLLQDYDTDIALAEKKE